MKPILDNLEIKDEPGQSNQLERVGWKLKVQVASEAQQKEKAPIAQVQFHTTRDNVTSGSREPINFEMIHMELSDMYNQMEAIQNELDSLRNGKWMECRGKIFHMQQWKRMLWVFIELEIREYALCVIIWRSETLY